MGTPTDPRLSDHELSSLQAALGIDPANDRRQHARHPFPEGFVVAVHVKRGEISETILARARDISASGVGLIHTGPLNESETCEVEMRTLEGETASIPGEVVRSRHVHGKIHDIAIQFHFEIDPAEFVRLSTPTATPGGGTEAAVEQVSGLTAQLIGELGAMIDARAAWEHLTAKVREVERSLAAKGCGTCRESSKKG